MDKVFITLLILIFCSNSHAEPNLCIESPETISIFHVNGALLRNCPSEHSYPFPQTIQDTRIVCGVPSRVN